MTISSPVVADLDRRMKLDIPRRCWNAALMAVALRTPRDP